MIPHKIAFFWSWGTTLSYLRYLSIATCRHHHPDWEITLYQAKYDDDLSLGWDFGDFRTKGVFGKDYSSDLAALGVKIEEYKPTDPRVLLMPPPNISDIFSYEHLFNNGGWYSDMDVIFTKNFDYISDSNYAFIGFGNLQDWVGIFGARKGSWVMESFLKPALDGFNPDSYNSTGTYAIIQACSQDPNWENKFKEGDNGEKNWRCPQDMFYPLLPVESGKLWKSEIWEHSGASTWAVHLYGGNGDFSVWNKKIDPSFIADTRNNQWICRYIRSLGNSKLFMF